MSTSKYMNDTPYVLGRADTRPPFVFTIKTQTPGGTATPINLSAYASSAVRVKIRERGAETNLAMISCTKIDGSIGQFQISSWPSAVTSALDSSGEPITGKLEGQFQLSRDGTFTDTQTVKQWALFDLRELFGE